MTDSTRKHSQGHPRNAIPTPQQSKRKKMQPLELVFRVIITKFNFEISAENVKTIKTKKKKITSNFPLNGERSSTLAYTLTHASIKHENIKRNKKVRMKTRTYASLTSKNY